VSADTNVLELDDVAPPPAGMAGTLTFDS